MKKIFLLILSLTLTFLFFNCKKLPDGYLSPVFRYEVSPIIVKQGRVEVFDPIQTDGSTRPLNITLAKVYNRVTGEDMTSTFLKKYPFKGWKGYYDITVDTTLDLINAKRMDLMGYPISINSQSGQLEANYTSSNLPLGQYAFDLEIENVAGKKYYAGIGEFDLIASSAYEISAMMIVSAIDVDNEFFEIPFYYGFDGVQVEHDDKGENKVVLRFLDKNENIFNPKTEILFRPNPYAGQSYFQTLKDYSSQTTYYDDRIEYTYAVTPFPFYSLGPSYYYFYRIPASAVAYDSDLYLSYTSFSCNILFSFQAFAYGTYFIDVIIPNVTRVP